MPDDIVEGIGKALYSAYNRSGTVHCFINTTDVIAVIEHDAERENCAGCCRGKTVTTRLHS
ncbi:MAG: hypothetical protein WA628_13140 [Terriglobales bacterium]